MGRRGQVRGVPEDHLIREGAQAALRDGLSVERAQRAGGGVARVGKRRLARRFALLVHFRERRARQVHLAANLHPLRRGRHRQPFRDAVNDGHVGRHVFAGDAVAAGDAAREPPALVGEREADAVDLQLGDVGERGLDRPVETAADAAVKVAQLGLVVGVLEAEHRDEMIDFREALRRPSADADGRRVRIGQLGMRALQVLELAHEGVVLRVGDLRRGVDVVALVVVPEEAAKLGDATSEVVATIFVRHGPVLRQN